MIEDDLIAQMDAAIRPLQDEWESNYHAALAAKVASDGTFNPAIFRSQCEFLETLGDKVKEWDTITPLKKDTITPSTATGDKSVTYFAMMRSKYMRYNGTDANPGYPQKPILSMTDDQIKQAAGMFRGLTATTFYAPYVYGANHGLIDRLCPPLNDNLDDDPNDVDDDNNDEGGKEISTLSPNSIPNSGYNEKANDNTLAVHIDQTFSVNIPVPKRIVTAPGVVTYDESEEQQTTTHRADWRYICVAKLVAIPEHYIGAELFESLIPRRKIIDYTSPITLMDGIGGDPTLPRMFIIAGDQVLVGETNLAPNETTVDGELVTALAAAKATKTPGARYLSSVDWPTSSLSSNNSSGGGSSSGINFSSSSNSSSGNTFSSNSSTSPINDSSLNKNSSKMVLTAHRGVISTSNTSPLLSTTVNTQMGVPHSTSTPTVSARVNSPPLISSILHPTSLSGEHQSTPSAPTHSVSLGSFLHETPTAGNRPHGVVRAINFNPAITGKRFEGFRDTSVDMNSCSLVIIIAAKVGADGMRVMHYTAGDALFDVEKAIATWLRLGGPTTATASVMKVSQ
jgi:hypothetical protein